MRQAILTKNEMLTRLLEEFRLSGFEGTTMSRISEVTGLGKASLYHHFPGGKEEMVSLVLEMVEEWIENNLMVHFEAEGDPAVRLKKVLKILAEFYDNGGKSCVFDVLAVGLPESTVQKSIQKSLKRLLEGFEKIGLDMNLSRAEAKVKAEQSLCLIQGSLVLSRGLQDKSRFVRQLKSIELMWKE